MVAGPEVALEPDDVDFGVLDHAVGRSIRWY
jgi:hypothetical protein